MRPSEIAEIANLSLPEKIDFVSDLWDEIARDEAAVPIREDHIVEIEQRWAAHEAEPDKLLSWAELRSRINRRKK